MDAQINEFIRVFLITFPLLMVADTIWRRRDELYLIKIVYLKSGWWDYIKALFIVVLTICAIVVGLEYAPFWLQYGWMNLFTEQGGHLVTHSMTSAVDVTNTGFHTRWWHWFMLVTFWTMLIWFIPLASHKEEAIFRRHYTQTRQMVTQSLKFGFAHLILGIPVIAGVMLALPGYLFAREYRSTYERLIASGEEERTAQEQAHLSSTRIHALYNFYIFFLIGLVMIGFLIVKS